MIVVDFGVYRAHVCELRRVCIKNIVCMIFDSSCLG